MFWESYIVTKAASMGNVQVLQWALYDHSHGPVCEDCFAAASTGRVNDLEWAEENGMRWLTRNLRELCSTLAENGHVQALRWIHEHIPLAFPYLSHLIIWCWMRRQLLIFCWIWRPSPRTTVATREHSMLSLDNEDVWFAAGRNGHVHVLEWLLDNGFTISNDALIGAAMGGHIDALLWTREHNLVWDIKTCRFAAFEGQLDALKWLGENS